METNASTSQSQGHKTKGPRPKYPWHVWSQGTHTATQGTHFLCTVPSFIALLHSKGTAPKTPQGFPASPTHVETTTKGTSVTFEFRYDQLPTQESTNE